MVFAAVRIFLVYFQVMKDWSDLEEKYQEMREKDPSSAEDFKKKMTERFQKTVQALEEESQAEKRQLQAMHQQRVISMINQKKKMAMACYTKALNENTPNTHRVQKCLQKLLRALHKDRHHTIQHFRHLLETSLDQVSLFFYFLFISTLFENYSKCRIWIFVLWHFSTNFCHIKTDLSGNTVWPQASGFQKLAKMDILWHF